MKSPFESGTFGDRYYQQVVSMSLDNLQRREKQLEQQLTYSMDDECKRMVCMQVVRAIINEKTA